MRRFYTFVILLVGAASSAHAQSVLRGRVLADSTRRAIGAAEIVVGPGVRVARATDTGAFRIDSLAPGQYEVVVRAIGFRAVSFPLAVGRSDTMEVDVVLTRGVQVLAPLRVEGPAPLAVSGKMLDFERRRRLGFGKFMTRDDLAAWGDLSISNAIRRVANVRLVRRPWKCGGGFAAASGRGGGKAPDSYCAELTAWYPVACYLAVFVDGRRVWAPGEPDPPNVDDYLSRDLEGVEVYRGADLPAELGGTGAICGAIVMWTRTGESPK